MWPTDRERCRSPGRRLVPFATPTKGDLWREAVPKILTCGASLILMGRLVRWTQRQTGTLPASLGPTLLGIGAAGTALMRRSGFWAVFVPAVLVFDDTDNREGTRRR
jgi:hypothetical protein